MPRARSPARDKAKELWLESGKKKLLKEIADELGVSEGTVRGWKNKDDWDSDVRNVPNKNTERSKRESIETTKKSGGNPNPVHKFSHHNNPSLLHGLRSKYLHQEQVEIMEAMEGLSVADQIWLQIEIKFSALMRMQKIMWVEDSNDHISVISGKGESTTYKVAFAYERYESYIKAQTRAMAEYRNLIKQFLTLAHENDERRLKLEGMQLDIEKKKAEIEAHKGPKEGADVKDWKQAVIAAANKRKVHEDG